MNKLKVSILIPSYNHGKTIFEAINSVCKQSYENLELIIVDDASTDNSVEIIKKYIKNSKLNIMLIVNTKNSGVCKTLNTGLKNSSGDIVAILASDDLMMPNRLNVEVKFFEENTGLNVLYTNGMYFNGNKKFGDVHRKIKKYLKLGASETKKEILSSIPGLYIQSMLIKRSFIIEIGGFDEETGSDDWSLNIRIFTKLTGILDFKFIDRVSFLYRLHGNQMHTSSSIMKPMIRKVIKRYFNYRDRVNYIATALLIKACYRCREKRYRRSVAYIKKSYALFNINGAPIFKIFIFFIRFLVDKFDRMLVNLRRQVIK